MKVLVVGSGGREHAIVDKISQSSLVDKIYCAPGNYGISLQAELVNIDANEKEKIVNFSIENGIDLVIIGPENALIDGLADDLRKNNVMVLGPNKNAALIEASKEFAKQLMSEYSIPNAKYESFSEYKEAVDYLIKENIYPIVIKYDGLAAGKGVYIIEDEKQGKEVLKALLEDKIYGNDKVIIEEFLDGDEFTLLAMVNKEKVYPFQPARDFKRVFDNDKGLNTGGMGAICPYHNVDEKSFNQALEILKQTASAMLDQGREYSGILYGGFIKTNEGVKVIEYNARFGDPETQCVLNNVASDLIQNILDLLSDKNVDITFKDQVSVGLVLSAPGYPHDYEKNIELNKYLELPFKIYHMQSKIESNKVLSNGGRVLFLLNTGVRSEDAYQKLYEELSKIDNHILHYRKDLNRY